MKLKLLLNCFVVFFIINVSYGAKILGLFPMPSPSHFILANAYLRALADAGHDVTMISPYFEKNPPPKNGSSGSYKDLVLTGFMEESDQLMKSLNAFGKERENPSMTSILNLMYSYSEKTLNHTVVQNLLKSNEKFDVVVIGQSLNDALKVLAIEFNAHLIVFSTLGANSALNSLVCNPSPISYIPETMLTFSPKMTFLQRLQNAVFYFFSTLMMQIYFLPAQAQLVEKYFPNAPPLHEFMYNVSLVLLNSHESLSNPIPLVPSMVNIGGFHIKEGKKLPKDLQDFLDSAEDGVIYFSMGSNLKSKNLPEEKRQVFLKTFSQLKQKVLWKWEDDTLPGQPENVKLGKWLPQQDILAHPNVKLFITHGGLLSTTETVYHGVPIVAIPIFGDQMMNAKRAELAGYGKVLPFDELSEKQFSSVLTEVLTNSKYTETAKIKSKILHDREVKPMDSAVYWTEYVIRHNGAKHLRVAGLELPWYKYMLLDVFGFILAVLLISAFVTKKLFCMVVKRVFTKKTKVKKN